MRKMKLAIVAALAGGLFAATLDTSASARGAGGAGAGAAGGGAGASGGGGTGGGSGGGSGGGFNPNMNPQLAVQPPPRGPRHTGLQTEFRAYAPGCYKYEPLFDRYGNTVAGWHDAACFGE